MGRTTALLLALLLLSAHPGAARAGYWVFDGTSVKRVEIGDPSQAADVEEWQVWLYKRDVPTGQRGFSWGAITGPTADDVMEQLEKNQAFERRYERWCQCGPTSLTYFNPLGPIAIARERRQCSERATTRYTELMSRLNRLTSHHGAMSLAISTGETLRNPFEGTGLSMMGYFEGYANAFSMQARLRDALSGCALDDGPALGRLDGMSGELDFAEQLAQRFAKAVGAEPSPARSLPLPGPELVTARLSPPLRRIGSMSRAETSTMAEAVAASVQALCVQGITVLGEVQAEAERIEGLKGAPRIRGIRAYRRCYAPNGSCTSTGNGPPQNEDDREEPIADAPAQVARAREELARKVALLGTIEAQSAMGLRLWNASRTLELSLAKGRHVEARRELEARVARAEAEVERLNRLKGQLSGRDAASSKARLAELLADLERWERARSRAGEELAGLLDRLERERRAAEAAREADATRLGSALAQLRQARPEATELVLPAFDLEVPTQPSRWTAPHAELGGFFKMGQEARDDRMLPEVKRLLDELKTVAGRYGLP